VRLVEGGLGALDGRHDGGTAKAVAGRANRGGRRKGGLAQWAGWQGGHYGPATGRLLWARPDRNSAVS
jgi:hypothetical protein